MHIFFPLSSDWWSLSFGFSLIFFRVWLLLAKGVLSTCLIAFGRPRLACSLFLRQKISARKKKKVYTFRPDTFKDTGWCTEKEKYRRKRHRQHWWRCAKGSSRTFIARTRRTNPDKEEKKKTLVNLFSSFSAAAAYLLLFPLFPLFYVGQTRFSSIQCRKLLFVGTTMLAVYILSSLLFFSSLSQCIVFASDLFFSCFLCFPSQ